MPDILIAADNPRQVFTNLGARYAAMDRWRYPEKFNDRLLLTTLDGENELVGSIGPVSDDSVIASNQ